MIKEILLIVVVIFFAMNMGASGIAPSFSSIYGSRLIRRKHALILFGLFVVIGGVLLGRNVAVTLGKNLLPKGLVTFDVTLIILTAATLGLFLANMLKIPQSTSQVTVGALVGTGMYFKHLNLKILFFKILKKVEG